MTSLGPYSTTNWVDRTPQYGRTKPSPNSILGLLEAEPDFSMFLRLVRLANLGGYLDCDSNLTVLVPSNKSIQGRINPDIWNNLNAGQARLIVQAHLIRGVHHELDLAVQKMVAFPTLLEGKPLIVDRHYPSHLGDIVLYHHQDHPALLLFVDIDRSNGVVHVIDELLLPENRPARINYDC